LIPLIRPAPQNPRRTNKKRTNLAKIRRFAKGICARKPAGGELGRLTVGATAF
jgi:hypothetical protein